MCLFVTMINFIVFNQPINDKNFVVVTQSFFNEFVNVKIIIVTTVFVTNSITSSNKSDVQTLSKICLAMWLIINY